MTISDSKIIRLLNVAVIAALGHVLSVILVPYAAYKFGSEVASSIAIVDSSIMLISAILAFGLSITVTRDVSQQKNWRGILSNCLGARFILSLFISVIALFLYFFSYINFVALMCFLSAPIIAFNLDFALYGRNQPIRAAYASFIRMSLPVLLFVSLPFVFDFFVSYTFLVIIFYVLSSAFVFYSLNLSPRFYLNINAIKLYRPVIYIGLAGLCITFQRLGFLTFFTADNKAILMLSSMLKIYLAFVAIRRLFIQTFYTSLLNESVYKKVEISCVVIGLAVGLSFIFFSSFFSELIFSNSEKDTNEFILFSGVLIIAGSFFATADARLFLENKDKLYYMSAFTAVAIWLASISLVSFFDLEAQYILVALAVTEFTLALTYRYHLVNR
jgi:hypothetical protein